MTSPSSDPPDSSQVNDVSAKYPILPSGINDLTIKAEVNRPLWQLELKELVGQNLFQTPIMSGYESSVCLYTVWYLMHVGSMSGGIVRTSRTSGSQVTCR